MEKNQGKGAGKWGVGYIPESGFLYVPDGFGAVVYKTRAIVDEAAVELHETGSCFYFLDCVLGRHDATHADNGDAALEILSECFQCFVGAVV